MQLPNLALETNPADATPSSKSTPVPSLKVWLERRYAGDEMVHQTLSLQNMSDTELAKLQQHYRVETIEFAPAGVGCGETQDAERLAYVLEFGRPAKWFDADGKDILGYRRVDAWSSTALGAIDQALELDHKWIAKRAALQLG
jgi:hypothetical protein